MSRTAIILLVVTVFIGIVATVLILVVKRRPAGAAGSTGGNPYPTDISSIDTNPSTVNPANDGTGYQLHIGDLLINRGASPMMINKFEGGFGINSQIIPVNGNIGTFKDVMSDGSLRVDITTPGFAGVWVIDKANVSSVGK